MSQSNQKENSETFKFPNLHAIPNSTNKDANEKQTEASEIKMDGVEMNNETEDKPVKKTAQFETEQSETEQHNQSSQPETNVHQQHDEEPPAKPKKKKNKSPLISKVTKIIKRVFFVGVIGIAAGSSYIWADQNGYVSMVMNTFKSEDVTSEIDIKQNEMITKFQLITSDLKKELSQANENRNKDVEEANKVRGELQSQITTLRKEYESYRLLSQKIISNNKSKNEINSLDIEQLKTSSLNTINGTSENKQLIETLQKEINRVLGKVNNVSAKANKLQSSINRTPKVVSKPVVAKEKPKVVVPKGPKLIYSYSGLTISQVFNWSTQKIAVLSDSAGTSIQVSRGNKLGNATITEVSSNYILIKDDLTGSVSKLIK